MDDSLETTLYNLVKSAFLEAMCEHQNSSPTATHLQPREEAAAFRRLLTIAEVAEWLAISERQVHKLTRSDGLPFLRIGRLIRYEVGSVRSWIKERDGTGVAHASPPRSKSMNPTPDRKRDISSEQKRSRPASSKKEATSLNRQRKGTHSHSAQTQSHNSQEPPRPSRLQMLAESLEVDYAELGPITNGDVRRVLGVDVPTHHGWSYHNRELPDDALARLREWLLTFKK